MKSWFTKLFRRRPPGSISCHQVGEVLQQYLDGEIDAELASRLAIHLEECRRCGMEAEVYHRIKATLATQRADIPAESIDRLREFGERLARGGEINPTPPTR